MTKPVTVKCEILVLHSKDKCEILIPVVTVFKGAFEAFVGSAFSLLC